MKKIIFLLFQIPLLLFCFVQTGPSGITNSEHFCMDSTFGAVYTVSDIGDLYKINVDTNEWMELITPEEDKTIYSIDALDNKIYVCRGNRLLRSYDGGESWSFADNGIWGNYNLTDIAICRTDSNILYLKVQHNAWSRSENGGDSWQEVQYFQGLRIEPSRDSDLLLIPDLYNINISYDFGISWSHIPNTLHENHLFWPANSLIINDSTFILAGFTEIGPNNNIFITYDTGISWQNLNYDFSFDLITDIEHNNIEIIITTSRSGSSQVNGGLYKLDEDNQTWQQIGTDFLMYNTGYSIFFHENLLYFSSRSNGIFIIENDNLWINLYPDNVYGISISKTKVNSNFNNRIIADIGFAHFSDDFGYSWSRIDSAYVFFDIAQSPYGQNFWVSTRVREGVYLSYDAGENWIYSCEGIAEEDRFLLGNIFFLSSDIILISGYLRENNQVVNTFLYRSEDQGLNWEKVLSIDYTGFETSLALVNVIKQDNIVYACSRGQGILNSNDLGLTWDNLYQFPSSSHYGLTYDEEEYYYIITGDQTEPYLNHIYKTNDLVYWSLCAEEIQEDYYFLDFVIDPSSNNNIISVIRSIFNVGIHDENMIISEDYGMTWDFVELVGLPDDIVINSISNIPETNEILLSTNYSIFRGDISEIVSTHEVTIVPCTGLTNYPNPFNPETTIVFNLPEDSKVKLEIYNIKGQKIKSLLNDQITTGEHSIVWNGEDDLGKKVSSGVYLYKLNVNGKMELVKKCMLLK